MPHIAVVGRKDWRMRLIILLMYVILATLGVTMVYPFLITITSTMSNSMDYNRYDAFPAWIGSRQERFTRGIVPYFPDDMRNGMFLFANSFQNVPDSWGSWQSVGNDEASIGKFADFYLNQYKGARREQIIRMAADYDAFAKSYDINDSICAYNQLDLPAFFREKYMGLAKKSVQSGASSNLSLEQQGLENLSKSWKVPFDSFYQITTGREANVPFDQPQYWPPLDNRATDFALLREGYQQRAFLPKMIKNKWYGFIRGNEARTALQIAGTGDITLDDLNKALGTSFASFSDVPYPVTSREPKQLQKLWDSFTGMVIPVCETRPFPMKSAWTAYLGSDDAKIFFGLSGGGTSITIADFNKLFGTSYASMQDIPFPVTANDPPKMRALWEKYVQEQYPMRLIEIRVTPALTAGYQNFIKTRLHGNIDTYNGLLQQHYASWSDIPFTSRMPVANESDAGIWMDYVKTLPFSVKIPHSAEEAYQQYLLSSFGTLDKVNAQYGWKLSKIQQAEMPFDMAYLVSFEQNERAFAAQSILRNYSFVVDYLVLRGRAIFNTLMLIALSLLAALTVNPLAAYALSRFQLRKTPQVILFMLATMAFPAAVSMIPGYLLMRDLHLLNTYAALILPGIANGMNIFLLKGFFDSLPPELYEASALDGAKEWQMFTMVTLPLSKPILAVIALNSFLAAYNSWEWALVVCQDQKMWTVAVWLYQFNTTFAGTQPWAVMSAFILASLPTFIIFILCQNVIMRGIILPQMK